MHAQSQQSSATPAPTNHRSPVRTPLINRLRLASKAARSGLRRYPRHLWESFRPQILDAITHPASPLEHFNRSPISAMWIGHATVLIGIEIEGGRRVHILTDPVLSDRIGVTIGQRTFGLRRLTNPAITEAGLPPIDVILLSHAHFDHLDRPTLRRLAAGPARHATVVTAARTSSLVPAGFRRVVEVPWSHSLDLGHIRLDALRPAHWGARTALDRNRGFNSYVIQSGPRRVLFAGDTAATDAFDRVGHVDLSIFGVGAYEPWEHAHATPEQVWHMFRHLRGNDGKLLPMHHSTFDLGEERPGEPLARLEAAAGSAWASVVCRRIGECFNCGDAAAQTQTIESTDSLPHIA